MNTYTLADVKMCTPSQARFILDLRQVDRNDDNYAEMQLALEQGMSRKEASMEIDRLKAEHAAIKAVEHIFAVPAIMPVIKPQPVATPAPVKVAPASKGEWHVLGGEFFLVAKSQSTGKLYAKKRNLTTGSFEYSAGVIFKLNNTTRVNAENISALKAYAELHSACMFCNLALSTPESVTAGYGPVCAEKNGLPW